MSGELDNRMCCIPGCVSLADMDDAPDVAELLCENHYLQSDPIMRLRLVQLQSRLALVESYWDDVEKYDQVVASGRYLKLANLTGWVSEAIEEVWNRLKLDAMIHAASRRGLEISDEREMVGSSARVLR